MIPLRNGALALLVLTGTTLHAQLALQPYAKIEPPAINESSGLVKSRQFENVYWTHNDSGDSARIFAITRDGKPIQTEWAKQNSQPYEGIPIADAVNIDWEDISTDSHGNLIIAACGNNDNGRRDLALYIVPEPDPRTAWKTRTRQRIDFHYPDQKEFPHPDRRDFDCESLFSANGTHYLVSKNRSTPETKLYRLDSRAPFKSNPLTLVSSFNLRGQATAADASPDGTKLAVLTYTSLWVFEKPTESDDYFSGKASYKTFFAKQCEAVCWDDAETLIITNEQRDLFEVKLSELVPDR
ncbi:hypothetical protein IEN85_21740 [Pelagicoccus sp. NFK12]|uniref:Uncharacterized protein n=1 Tax=Pelagicoccus enzymogenes TaxID=2773457 RepID=A0A927FE50_9BACT|nr:hypothetical protein [Pelagicoccus enzymogenes]MBD5782136.1 hypothetical protein [Pelagicoccus enzymogenes]MDQ8196889.1 hypothetical protein [Pelagicoccus enzymogenes]